ncbi:Pr6Pr family membrane protein [Rathayibacter agropyri]|uniref:Pr6Pr family membrane protein n=1 Tax=Rathayibacter agropyri TaxID=1634927 RepID=UPI00156647E8|nr:Pr6Pr family membrane protein [Rathayibacter agropyri]NRD10097.1 Pr6Pr family membrane protein [Rathayibacter agropyri]
MACAASIRSAVGTGRIAVGVLSISAVAYAYSLNIAAGDPNPFDYFGYFTNQTSLFASVTLIIAGAFARARRPAPTWLSHLRGVATAYLIVVAVIYNTLVPGTGTAPPWVSTLLHVVLPVLAVLDWALLNDRSSLSWRRLWIVLPYPLLWLVVVLVRGVTDGWVPYGFLLPENGAASLVLHVLGLICVVLVAGAIVWGMSRGGRRAGAVDSDRGLELPAEL